MGLLVCVVTRACREFGFKYAWLLGVDVAEKCSHCGQTTKWHTKWLFHKWPMCHNHPAKGSTGSDVSPTWQDASISLFLCLFWKRLRGSWASSDDRLNLRKCRGANHFVEMSRLYHKKCLMQSSTNDRDRRWWWCDEAQIHLVCCRVVAWM